jgi:hypothetical protein
MPIDDLTARVKDIVREYADTRSRSLILGAEADREGASLWKAVRAVDPDTAPRWLDAQLTEANVALGWLHYFRYREAAGSRRQAELARAVLCLEPAADDASVVPAELRRVVGRFTDPDAQADLAASLLRAAAASDDPALLDAGIQLMIPASAARPRDAPERVARLSRLCLARADRYERDGTPADLEQAIAAGEEATAIMARHGPQAAGPWSSLARAYRSRHQLHGDLADLERVVDLLERVLALAGPGPGVLADLATAYRQRYEQAGAVADIERAVALAEQAAAPDGPADPAVLASLGNALLRRYERAGTEQDLGRAADLAERAVSAVPGTDPRRSTYLADAASVLLRRYERSREPKDLDRAVGLCEQALSALAEEDPGRPDILVSLAVTLHQRYLSTGADADLNRAATLIGWALAAITASDARRPRALIGHTAIYSTRHAHTGVLADINQAIDLGEQAVAAAADCPPQWLTTLSGAYQNRFQAAGTVTDLDRAIELGEDALAATGEEDFAQAGRQVRLAAAYWRRYGHHGSRADLDRAIDLGRRAVTATPSDYIDRPERMSSLAGTLLARYRLDQEPADLEDAITLGQEALAQVPAGHPDQARLTAGLGVAHLERVTAEGAVLDQADLGELARSAAEAQTAPPAERVSAHHAIGALAQACGHPELAATMLDAAIALLPSTAPREAGWADQQHRLGAHFGLVETAVAAHCAVGDPTRAVEIAELGRGVLLASQASTRVDLTGLADQDPRLADRFRWVCERLNTPDFPAQERKRWWADYDRLLASIRERPGLGDFLAPPRLDGLRPAAAGGCVILVNASGSRSDAVVIRAEAGPVMVPLPALRLADVEANVAALLEVFDDELPTMRMKRRRREVVTGILGWLWDAAVAPILAVLPSDDAATPRIWWLPTGLLGLLPLHAAGHPGQPGALDAAVSSFVPSLRALRDARARPPARHRSSLTVALHRTPGQQELAGAASDVTHSDDVLLDEMATASHVLAALQQATWAHFACHAVADPASQASSGLLLHDRMLRLPEIGGLRLHEAELAYLSACSTANHGTRYADEVLHLGSAFQLAGFRHVIASLWPLDDSAAAEAARSFRGALPNAPVASEAAAALREVTLRLRDEHPNHPDLWAPLIHSGP